MKKMRRFLAFVLCAALCFLLLTGCGSRDTIRFKMIAELNQEEFCVAFRKGDPLCDIFTAALKELSADGQISRLSAQYLGTDYTCMEALPGALQLLETARGRSFTEQLIHEGLDYPITFRRYPRGGEWLLAMRARVNAALRAALREGLV